MLEKRSTTISDLKSSDDELCRVCGEKPPPICPNNLGGCTFCGAGFLFGPLLQPVELCAAVSELPR